MATTNKGFIKDWAGNYILPITRGELVLDQDGKVALTSSYFEAGVNGNQYGLISAQDIAKLKGGSSGQSMEDIYKKLQYINEGLIINTSTLNFYDEDGKATPITITSTGDNKINIASNGNIVNLTLQKIHDNGLTASNILKSITVDQYGRVTEVSGSLLTNEEIPETLTGKIFNSCKTAIENIGSETTAIVNKKYVDDKIQEVTGLATGALKFGGPLDDADAAVAALKNENFYYKVTEEFILASEYLYLETEQGSDGVIEVGDTLVVYKSKFVHIPSGDDITTITVRGVNDAKPVMTSATGNVLFEFSDVFQVTNSTGGNVAQITLPAANGSFNGYLSKEDWTKFTNYANNLLVEYVPTVQENSTGFYEIGVINVGTDKSYTIYGTNYSSSLTLINGETDASNPILKFKETGVADYDITVKGINGIKTRKDGNNLEISADNQVVNASKKYLEITSGHQFKVLVGSKSEDTVTPGLTDYEEFNTFRQQVALTFSQLFEPIENSLTDTGAKYHYGSTDLISVVTI